MQTQLPLRQPFAKYSVPMYYSFHIAYRNFVVHHHFCLFQSNTHRINDLPFQMNRTTFGTLEANYDRSLLEIANNFAALYLRKHISDW